MPEYSAIASYATKFTPLVTAAPVSVEIVPLMFPSPTIASGSEATGAAVVEGDSASPVAEISDALMGRSDAGAAFAGVAISVVNAMAVAATKASHRRPGRLLRRGAVEELMISDL